MFTGDKPVYKRPFGLREEALITQEEQDSIIRNFKASETIRRRFRKQLLFFMLAFLIIIIDPSVPLQLIRVIFTGCVVVHKFCVQQPDVIHKKKPWWEILMNEFGSLFFDFFLSEGMPTGFGSELEGRPEILRMDQPNLPEQAPPLNYPAEGAAIPHADHPIPAEAGEQEPAPRAGFQRLPWQEALDLPKGEPAPPCLKRHVRQELVRLFNIGYCRNRQQAFVEAAIEPLNIEEATVGFCKALLKRVEELQTSHYNGGDHLKFAFQTKADKERLYSIMWEYAASVPATDDSDI